jgi:predicted nucleotidyltransferase
LLVSSTGKLFCFSGQSLTVEIFRRPYFAPRLRLIDYAKLQTIAAEHPHPLVFATVSGAHLYGFPSADSDYDLRGVHLLPLADMVGLRTGAETIQVEEIRDGLELDLVTHDAKKFFALMLRKNGYVLEQLFSPLVVCTSSEHAELKSIAQRCLTRFHAHHYLGFARTEWELFARQSPPRVKPLLYIFRVLLTGIYLLRSGQIEANLVNLNEVFELKYIPELIERKVKGQEKGILPDADLEFYRREYERLVVELELAMERSGLPEKPSAEADLNDLLIRLRLKELG